MRTQRTRWSIQQHNTENQMLHLYTSEKQMLHLKINTRTRCFICKYTTLTPRTKCFIYKYTTREHREPDASSIQHENTEKEILHPEIYNTITQRIKCFIYKFTTREQRTRCFIGKYTTREHREPDASFINIQQENTENQMLHL